MTSSEFDQYATDYESALQQGLQVSGESSEYFAVGRVEWLSRRLVQMGIDVTQPMRMMDFGCGTGNSVQHLISHLNTKHVVGIDTSEQSLAQARQRYPSDRTLFLTPEQYEPGADLDMVFCNGVFHHIPIEARSGAVDLIRRSLKPGGIFAFWENNPWNPGTRWIMSRIPFDRDAIVLSIPTGKRLLASAGFSIERVDTRFYFPKLLSGLRFLESALCKLPLGAQYLILARSPPK